MKPASWRAAAALVPAAIIGILAPVGPSPAMGAAECPTCCPQPDAKCVVCGTKACASFDDSYEARAGTPCDQQTS